jgi:ketosteroid isomerase-like protein
MILSNSELARRGFEAVVRGDLDAIREMLDPDVKWHGGDPNAVGACRNREQALDYCRDAMTHQPVRELVELIEAGDKVVVVMRSSSEDGSDSMLTANVTTFRDGKAIEIVHFPNPDDARAAAGVTRA